MADGSIVSVRRTRSVPGAPAISLAAVVPLTADSGTYRLRARAVDTEGHLGNPSQYFTLTIVPPKTPPNATPAVQIAKATPQGPVTAMKS